jgi:hypothetical protein
MANQQNKVSRVHFGRLGALSQKLSVLLQKLSILLQGSCKPYEPDRFFGGYKKQKCLLHREIGTLTALACHGLRG